MMGEQQQAPGAKDLWVKAVQGLEVYGQPLLSQFGYEDRVYPGLTAPQCVHNS